VKILVSDPLADEGLEILKAEHDVDVNTGLSEDELVSIIPGYDALVIRSGTKVTEKIINAADRLKIVGRAGVGVDNIDVPAATRKGIIVANTPEGNTISAAEHTIAMMLALSRNVAQANASLKAGKWERKLFTGSEVRGKVLGTIGLGRVGIGVVKRAQGLEMKIIAYDPFIPKQRAKELGIELVDLETVLKKSDYITVHTPLTDETRGMVSDSQFEMMKPGVRIINCARGGVIDEDALVRAVNKNQIAGAALDVFVNEPPTGSQLLDLDRVINLPQIQSDAMSVVAPYIGVAETLGGMCAQLMRSFDEIEIEYSGAIFDTDIRMVTLAALKAVLSQSMGPSVNYVNAPELAKERKIKIKESKSIETAEPQSITIALTGGGESRSVTGALISDALRILSIDGYRLDIAPSSYMIISRHENHPNIIGPCCMILGREKINISGMQVSETGTDDRAIMVLNVDSDVPDALLGEIRGVDGVSDAELIRV
jgi:D-3-phosphoglycerate dehydrogenase